MRDIFDLPDGLLQARTIQTVSVEILANVGEIVLGRVEMAYSVFIVAYAALAWYDQIALAHLGWRLSWRRGLRFKPDDVCRPEDERDGQACPSGDTQELSA